MDQHIDDFAITAQVSPAERRFLTLKHGDTFGVFDQSGQMVSGPGNTVGLYHRDTRFLSEFEAVLGGRAPILLSSTLRDDNATLTCDLSNPDLGLRPGQPDIGLSHDLIHMRRSRFLWKGVLYERIMVRNFDVAAHGLSLELRFGADFADLFEVRGMRRARHGQHEPAVVEDDTVTLCYVGLDSRRRETRLRFYPTPNRLNEGRAVFDLDLRPGGRALVYAEIGCDTAKPARDVPKNFIACMIEQRRWTRMQSARAAAIESSNSRFNEAMQRAISDLTMLVTELPTGPYPYAGVPWFSTAFGRDGIITALNVLWMDPSIALGVLRYLAANQATETDAASDAEPGKILHEVRNGEMAELGEVPFRRYYGSVDSTPLFVMLAGAYLDRTGDVAALREIWPHVRAALEWIDSQADQNPHGFVAYFRKTPDGLANQGWKDSFDSISHADGTLAEGPIALCEVQGYVFAARCAAARIALALGQPDIAARLHGQAEALRVAFERHFWLGLLGTYAIALDGAGRACEIRASNAGQLLMTGIVSHDRARLVADGLMETRFFTGWGIRTLASGESRYNPMSYHNGSVWPHDNALIAMGMARYGMKDYGANLFESFFDAALYIDCRSCSAVSPAGAAKARPSTRWPARRRPGPLPRCTLCSPPASACNSIPPATAWCSTGRVCRRSLTR
jgi:glycogen debranching enzyme